MDGFDISFRGWVWLGIALALAVFWGALARALLG